MASIEPVFGERIECPSLCVGFSREKVLEFGTVEGAEYDGIVDYGLYRRSGKLHPQARTLQSMYIHILNSGQPQQLNANVESAQSMLWLWRPSQFRPRNDRVFG